MDTQAVKSKFELTEGKDHSRSFVSNLRRMMGGGTHAMKRLGYFCGPVALTKAVYGER